MKQIAVVDETSGKIYDRTIGPGTTVSELLRDLDMESHELWKLKDESPLASDENVYTSVEDGEKLKVQLPMTVGFSCTTTS